MPFYNVRIGGRVIEDYSVEADSPEEAAANWHEGELVMSQAWDMDESSITVTRED